MGKLLKPKGLDFFLDPISIIKHYKTCPLNESKTPANILGYGLEAMYCHVAGKDALAGAHSALVDAHAQATVCAHPGFLAFYDRPHGIENMEDVWRAKRESSQKKRHGGAVPLPRALRCTRRPRRPCSQPLVAHCPVADHAVPPPPPTPFFLQGGNGAAPARGLEPAHRRSQLGNPVSLGVRVKQRRPQARPFLGRGGRVRHAETHQPLPLLRAPQLPRGRGQREQPLRHGGVGAPGGPAFHQQAQEKSQRQQVVPPAPGTVQARRPGGPPPPQTTGPVSDVYRLLPPRLLRHPHRDGCPGHAQERPALLRELREQPGLGAKHHAPHGLQGAPPLPPLCQPRQHRHQHQRPALRPASQGSAAPRGAPARAEARVHHGEEAVRRREHDPVLRQGHFLGAVHARQGTAAFLCAPPPLA